MLIRRGDKKGKLNSEKTPFLLTLKRQKTTFSNFVGKRTQLCSEYRYPVLLNHFSLNLLSNMIRIITRQTTEWTKRHSLSCHRWQINRLTSWEHTSKARKIWHLGEKKCFFVTTTKRRRRQPIPRPPRRHRSLTATILWLCFVFLPEQGRDAIVLHHPEHFKDKQKVKRRPGCTLSFQKYAALNMLLKHNATWSAHHFRVNTTKTSKTDGWDVSASIRLGQEVNGRPDTSCDLRLWHHLSHEDIAAE